MKTLIGLFLLCLVFVELEENFSFFTIEDAVVVLSDKTICEKINDQPQPAIVLFYVDWCSHCRRFHPVYSKIAKEYRCKIIIYIFINI